MTDSITRDCYDAIQAAYPIPDYIQACANAVAYDLNHGPSYSCIPAAGIKHFTDGHYATYADDLVDDIAADGDTIEPTYTGTVAATLRDYIDNLPGTLYVDLDCDYVSEREPEGEWVPAENVCLRDDDGEPDTDGYETDGNGNVYIEPYTANTYRIEGREIVRALFGRTIANEFY